jgi:hypothetical protein
MMFLAPPMLTKPGEGDLSESLTPPPVSSPSAGGGKHCYQTCRKYITLMLSYSTGKAGTMYVQVAAGWAVNRAIRGTYNVAV